MTLPGFGQNIARIDIELDDILDLNITAPTAGDILIYDGDSWDNRFVTGDITISAAGVVAVVPGTPRQIYQTNAAGLAAEWTSLMDGITIGSTIPAPGTFNTLTKTGTTGLTWTNVSDEDYELLFLSGVTGGPRMEWDDSEQAFSFNFGLRLTTGALGLGEGTPLAGTVVYLARDNAGDLTFNALAGKTVNVAIAGTDEYVFSAATLDMNSNDIREIGNAGSQLLADAWTMVSANAQLLSITTTGGAADAELKLILPASSVGATRIHFIQGSGDGSANNMEYRLFYTGNTGIFGLFSQDIDGASANGNIFQITDGTNDVLFAGGISTDGVAAPIAGMNIGAHALFNTSVDSALVADQVGFGRYDIGVGNTVIALSQETAVVAASTESDFSHAMQVRINGVSYFIMLASSLS